jgi:hypothetical protein
VVVGDGDGDDGMRMVVLMAVVEFVGWSYMSSLRTSTCSTTQKASNRENFKILLFFL